MARWHMPLDPDCPAVQDMWESLSDPITVAYGIGGEIFEHFEAKHRAKCDQCQAYGAENIEVNDA